MTTPPESSPDPARSSPVPGRDDEETRPSAAPAANGPGAAGERPAQPGPGSGGTTPSYGGVSPRIDSPAGDATAPIRITGTGAGGAGGAGAAGGGDTYGGGAAAPASSGPATAPVPPPPAAPGTSPGTSATTSAGTAGTGAVPRDTARPTGAGAGASPGLAAHPGGAPVTGPTAGASRGPAGSATPGAATGSAAGPATGPATGSATAAAMGAAGASAAGSAQGAAAGAPTGTAAGNLLGGVTGSFTDPAPRGTAAAANPAAAQPLRATGKPRRARLVVRRVDPWSVLKFSLLFSICLLIVFVVAVAALYYALDSLGVFESVNQFVRDITQAGTENGRPTGGFDVTISPGRVIGGAAVIGAINVVIITAISTLGAFLYNLCSDIVGGIEVTLAERN